MNFNPVPKPPADKPKKKKQNGWKDKDKRVCFYHPFKSSAERHEVYGGNPNRQISINHGFQVDLCMDCHKGFHNPQTEEDWERIIFWKRYYQETYESKLIISGVSKRQARELWMLLIGKNYLEEVV